MEDTTIPRLKRRRLIEPKPKTELSDDGQDHNVHSGSTNRNQGHVYSSIILDGNAQAVFGNVSNIGRHFHIVGDEIYQRAFLNKIYFEGMDARRHQLAAETVLPKTVQWIWKTNFVAWLKGPDSFFWINGRGGSGKSVLTKYACESSKTLMALQFDNQKWITLYYFFSFSGSRPTNTMHGMLRSLLYQLVRRLPEVRQLVHSAYFVDNFPSDNLQDCIDALSDIVRYASTRICVFIDGFDEFDGPISRLLEVIDTLQERTGIKVCIASRRVDILEQEIPARERLTMREDCSTPVSVFVRQQSRQRNSSYLSEIFERSIAHGAAAVTVLAPFVVAAMLAIWRLTGLAAERDVTDSLLE